MRIDVVKEIPTVKIAENQLGPFEAEDRVDLFGWEARVLVRRGDARAELLLPSDLRRKIISEENRTQLGDLSPDFFWRVRESISLLRAQGREEEASELKQLVQRLIDARVLKLLKLAVDPESASTQVPEERYLLNLIAKILEHWSAHLESFMELGGEVKPRAGAV